MAKHPLGKLHLAGLCNVEEVPLYMPVDYADYRYPVTDFDISRLMSGCDYLFECTLASSPVSKFYKGRPQTAFTVTDGALLLQFVLFGDVREDVEKLTQVERFYVHGTLNCTSSGAYINNAKLIEPQLVGRVHAIYPGVPGKLRPATVAKLISTIVVGAIPAAAEKVRKLCQKHFQNGAELRRYLQCQRMTLEELLYAIHVPETIEIAHYAYSIFHKIATLCASDALLTSAAAAKSIERVKPIVGWPLERLTKNVPFQITAEQRDIVQRHLTALSAGEKVNTLLVGDVGTGKTVTYGLIVGFVCSAGGRVAVLLPNGRLAEQIHRELSDYFPEFNPLLVNGNSDHTEAEMSQSKLLIGTSALLFRQVGEFSLVVVDEQQKMSSTQRSQLCSGDTSVIEVSATPIPRSLALAEFGAVNIECITHCHAVKTIDTRIMEKHQARELMQMMYRTVNAGAKVLVVCAKREADDKEDDLPDAQTVARQLERYFPRNVSLAHAGLSDEDNAKALQDIVAGTTNIIVSTVVIEVGITIPKLEMAIVYHAERFGLTQLHQIRGRLVRHGGHGNFVLYLPKMPKNPVSLERMQALCDLSDGFELARHDLRLRGIGDIEKGSTQHGSFQGLIRNMPVTIDDVESVVEQLG
jgi:ATP-dependent DNA helicase RecG